MSVYRKQACFEDGFVFQRPVACSGDGFVLGWAPVVRFEYGFFLEAFGVFLMMGLFWEANVGRVGNGFVFRVPVEPSEDCRVGFFEGLVPFVF